MIEYNRVLNIKDSNIGISGEIPKDNPLGMSYEQTVDATQNTMKNKLHYEIISNIKFEDYITVDVCERTLISLLDDIDLKEYKYIFGDHTIHMLAESSSFISTISQSNYTSAGTFRGIPIYENYLMKEGVNDMIFLMKKHIKCEYSYNDSQKGMRVHLNSIVEYPDDTLAIFIKDSSESGFDYCDLYRTFQRDKNIDKILGE